MTFKLASSLRWWKAGEQSCFRASVFSLCIYIPTSEGCPCNNHRFPIMVCVWGVFMAVSGHTGFSLACGGAYISQHQLTHRPTRGQTHIYYYRAGTLSSVCDAPSFKLLIQKTTMFKSNVPWCLPDWDILTFCYERYLDAWDRNGLYVSYLQPQITPLSLLSTEAVTVVILGFLSHMYASAFCLYMCMSIKT